MKPPSITLESRVSLFGSGSDASLLGLLCALETRLCHYVMPVLVPDHSPSSEICGPVACSPPASSAHGSSRQEYWGGLPCPPPGNLPYPGIKPGFPALPADSLSSEPPGNEI